MSEEILIEEKAVFIQETKKEMFRSIAELNELYHMKSQLQIQSTDLKCILLQLKKQLYEQQQKNVSLGLEKIQLQRQRQKQTEKLQVIKSNMESVLSEIQSKRQEGQKLQRENNQAKYKSKILEAKIKQIDASRKDTLGQIKQFDKKIQLLQISCQRRNEISDKLQETVNYFIQKFVQIKGKCQKCKQAIEKIQNQSKDIKQSIQNSSLKGQCTIQIVQENIRQIAHQQQGIQSQKLKRKLLQEKYTMLKERLYVLQQQQKYCRIIIDKKKTQNQRIQHNQNLKLSKWKQIKSKVQLQIQYTQHFYQRIII